MKKSYQTGGGPHITDTAFLRSCTCGRDYTAETWRQLPFGGVQYVPEGGPGEPAYLLEYRHCVCNSTLAIERMPEGIQ